MAQRKASKKAKSATGGRGKKQVKSALLEELDPKKRVENVKGGLGGGPPIGGYKHQPGF